MANTNKSSNSKDLAILRVLAGKNLDTNASHEQAEAIHQQFEKMARHFYHLPQTMAHYAATGAPVTFFKKPRTAAEQAPKNTPTTPGFTKK